MRQPKKIETEPTQVPKKRGRQPKKAAAPETPKRRGRPAKTVSETAPKRRGRPAKSNPSTKIRTAKKPAVTTPTASKRRGPVPFGNVCTICGKPTVAKGYCQVHYIKTRNDLWQSLTALIGVYKEASKGAKATIKEFFLKHGSEDEFNYLLKTA